MVSVIGICCIHFGGILRKIIFDFPSFCTKETGPEFFRHVHGFDSVKIGQPTGGTHRTISSAISDYNNIKISRSPQLPQVLIWGAMYSAQSVYSCQKSFIFPSNDPWVMIMCALGLSHNASQYTHHALLFHASLVAVCHS